MSKNQQGLSFRAESGKQSITTARWRASCLLLLLASQTILVFAQGTVPIKQTLAAPMRDGATLDTDLYLPSVSPEEKTAGTLPVILVCTPYDKSKHSPITAWRDCFLRNGYAVAVQDMRGFYASATAGKGAPRHYDGYDTVEWLAKQPWCNGKVGMLGYSHLGAVQYETAITAPPHLACAIPAQAPGNYYTNSYFSASFRIVRRPFRCRRSHPAAASEQIRFRQR